ncbi:MAG: hypothetical protein DLM60_07980 [Pseudonocardiales bacterium]|nr:MAG: hypothetical protein DLM60_07980 [Pseudonocardiales bacterium]
MTTEVERSEVTTPSGEPTLVNLHAKLLLEDADIGDVLGALDDESCTWYTVDLDDGALREVTSPLEGERMNLVVRRRPPGTARWKPFLSGLGVPLSQAETSDTESALVVVRTTTAPPRALLWCFGSASLTVPNELVDGRFGLIVALNKHTGGSAIASWRHLPDTARRRRRTGDPAARVRRLDADIRDGYRHTMVAKSPAPSPVAGLGFDSVSDLLRALRVATPDELMPDLEGGRGLKFSTYLDGWRDFAILADYLVALRSRTDYQRDWDWVDHVVPVAPRAEVERLLGELFTIIGECEDAPVDLVLPELDDDGGDGPTRLCFGMGHGPTIRTPVTWSNVRRQLLRLSVGATTPLRRRLRLKPDGAPDSTTVDFPLIDLLVGEFDHDDHHYVLSDGELLIVDVDFLSRLNADLAKIAWSDFPFPSWGGGTEPGYLATVEPRSRRRMVVLDRRNIELAGQTPFEPCDLFTDDGRLVFAKVKGRSSTFSHLCTQAEVAAELFLQHAAARDALLDRIAAQSPGDAIERAAMDTLAALEGRRSEAVTITLLFLGTWRKRDVRTLPLVSRLRLRRAANWVTALGYRFEVASPDVDITVERRRQ